MNYFLERLKEDLDEFIYTFILMVIFGAIISVFTIVIAYILVAILSPIPQ